MNFDLLYSTRCVFDFTAVLTCVIIFGHVDENLTELACICSTVEMHVVYMNRKFGHIRGIFGTYTQVLKTVLHDLTCQRNVVVFGCNYSEAVHFLSYVVIFCIFLVIKAFFAIWIKFLKIIIIYILIILCIINTYYNIF